MIRVGQLQLTLYLKNKLPFNIDKLNVIKEAISAYKYPSGMLAEDLVSQNALYENASLEENIEYLKSILGYLYKDIYSEQEINIIIAYLMSCNYTTFILNDELKLYFYSFIQLNSTKPEIQYYIDEIKYRYLISLVYSHTSSSEEKNLINTLSEQLSLIEQEHNALPIHEQLK